MFRLLLIGLLSLSVTLVAGCGKEEKPRGSTGSATKPSDAPSHHKVIELGSRTMGPYSVRAARDEGVITPGKDAPIDVWVDGPSASKVAAVRFWIGTEDAKGSVKARAQIEFPDQPNHWHTHAEIPSPLPAGSHLWVEIEDDNGVKSTGSFELKA